MQSPWAHDLRPYLYRRILALYYLFPKDAHPMLFNGLPFIRYIYPGGL